MCSSVEGGDTCLDSGGAKIRPRPGGGDLTTPVSKNLMKNDTSFHLQDSLY